MQKKGMVLELASSAYRETAGTFTRVEQRVDEHTLESTDSEKLYTVEEVISNPGENEKRRYL